MRYEAVIFDLFGTLADNFTTSGYMAALAEMASALAIPPDRFRRAWFETSRRRNAAASQDSRNDVEMVCRECGVASEEARTKEAVNARLSYIRTMMTPRPGAIDMLSELRRRGYQLGLISDCSHEIPAVWPETAFAPLFHAVVFSCAVGMRKPDPRVYHLAAERLGVRPERCLFVGDGGSQELSGAQQVGMHPVLIRLDADSTEAHLGRREQWDGLAVCSLQEILTLVAEGTGA